MIPKGQFTFLIGDSGSGKSSIIDMLLRLQNPNSGEITCDGVNINTYSKTSWRNKISYVSEDILLFNKTIRENILDGKYNSNDEEIYSTLKK